MTVNYIYMLITLVILANRPLFSCLVLQFIADLAQKNARERFTFLLKTGYVSNLLIPMNLAVNYIYKLITLVTLVNRPLPVILHKVPCFTQKNTREGLLFYLKPVLFGIFIDSCHKFVLFFLQAK
jgi:hypothetical protein